MTKNKLTDESIILIHETVRESPYKPKTLRLLVLAIELCLFDQMEHCYYNKKIKQQIQISLSYFWIS